MPPLALLLDLVLHLVLPAAVTAAVLVLIAIWSLDRKWLPLATALAISCGILAGNYSRLSLPYIPDGYGWPWLLPAMIAITLVAGIAFTSFGKNRAVGAVLIAVTTLALAFVLLPVELHRAECLLGFVAVALANAFVLAKVSERTSPQTLYLLSTFVLLKGTALVSIYSHFARVTDGAAIVASALIGLLAINCWKPISFKVAGQLLALTLPALMLSAQQNTYSEIPVISFILIAIAPLAFIPALLPAFKKFSPRAQLAALIVLPIIPVAIAFGLAIKAEGFAIGH